MIINGIEEIVPFGNFIIEKPDSEEAKEKTSFTGYDYMVKFNTPYKNRVLYPIPAGDLLEDLCNQVGIEVGNIDFINANYMILGNPFTNNENCRTVLSNIAQLAGGFARIGRDSKLYIISLKNISNLLKVKDVNAMTVKEFNATIVKLLSGEKSNAKETIDGNNYFDDFSKNEQWGELNSLILRISNIEGENSSRKDNDSITKNGLTEIIIEDNYFLTDQNEREKVIEPLWNNLNRIKYLPFKSKYYGYPYLDSGDLIYIQDTKDIGYISYVFNHTFEYNGGFSGELNTPALTKTQTTYKNTRNGKTKFRQVERKIDKINGIIEDIIEEQTETSNKLSQHEQTIDSISDKVESIQDLTQTEEGTKTITLANCVEGDLLELHIYGNNNVFKYLYPSDTLFPSDTLYPYGDSRIVVTDKDNNSKTYELGVTDVLRQNGNICDEYILEGGQAKVIRRINKDGTIKSTETIENLGEYSIRLKNGTNKISIKNYTATVKAKYAIQNDYTEIFSSKVETKTAIEQTAEDIDISVNKKLENYSTTTEMNSAINLTANEINSEVSKKVGEDEIISKINQSAESVQIDAEKVSLEGKEINLTSDDISIKSDTLNIDSNGNMTLTGKENVANIKIVLGTNKNRYVTINPARLVFTNDSTGNEIVLYNASNGAWIQLNSGSRSINILNDGKDFTRISLKDSSNETIVDSSGIKTPVLTQTSLETGKKNFEKLANALEIIKNTEIYKYNLKSQKDEDKKHIGFVIGEKYKHSNEITSVDENGKEIGADIYSMVSVAYKAIQEQQEQIEKLQKEIEEMKGEQNG